VEADAACDPAIAARIRRDLHEALALSPAVRLCAPGSIERPQGKAVRVVDRRTKR
jgi:phenylacetate-coenzyme A ligase PaaK-like adenylate-forming protein